jgi:type IV pilus biogenesis protein CpaD/CtpE
MKRSLAVLLLAATTMLAGACTDDSPTSGDSNPDNQQTQEPATESS